MHLVYQNILPPPKKKKKSIKRRLFSQHKLAETASHQTIFCIRSALNFFFPWQIIFVLLFSRKDTLQVHQSCTWKSWFCRPSGFKHAGDVQLQPFGGSAQVLGGSPGCQWMPQAPSQISDGYPDLVSEFLSTHSILDLHNSGRKVTNWKEMVKIILSAATLLCFMLFNVLLDINPSMWIKCHLPPQGSYWQRHLNTWGSPRDWLLAPFVVVPFFF